MTLSVRSRFEVFKRDGFTCGYCGRTPDDEGVKLEVDHITPRASGGTDDLTNLVTSCWDCNHGKAARGLDDKAPSLTVAMTNTRERALQLDEYRKWQGELDEVSLRLVVRVWEEWIACFGGHYEDDEAAQLRRWFPVIELPKRESLSRYFDTLEVADILDAIQATHRKWAANGLADYDVHRYFFGSLKGKSADKRQPSGNAFDEGYHRGVDVEHRRIRALFLDHTANGFETYGDVVNALWPEDA